MDIARPKVFYGWWIAVSFFFINFYWSGLLVSGFTTFFNPWKESFQLSSASTSLSFSIQQGMAGLGAVLVGLLFDKFGGRILMLLATALSVSGLLFLSASQYVWQFYLSFGIISVGYTIFFAGIGPALAAIWFRKHRGKANGLLLCGSNLGGVLAPLLVWVIDSYGWRTACVASAFGLLAIGIPTSMALRHKPEQYGLLPDGDYETTQTCHDGEQSKKTTKMPEDQHEEMDFTLTEALRTWTFWCLAFGQSLAIFGLVAVSVHIFPHLESEGFSRDTGAQVLMVVTMLGLITKVGFGWLGDVLNKRIVLAGSYLLQGLGILALANVENSWTLGIFILVYGLSAQSFGSVLYPLLADEYGHRHIGAIQGMIAAPYALGAFLGPYLAGITFDVMGEYTWVFVAFGCATIMSAPTALASGTRPFQGDG